ACPLLPPLRSLYITRASYDLLAHLVEKSAKEEYKDDWSSWLVTCKYDTKRRVHGPEQSRDNPELEYPDVSWNYTEHEFSPDRDLDRKRYANSAFDGYSPPQKFKAVLPTLIIKRNELTYTFTRAERYG